MGKDPGITVMSFVTVVGYEGSYGFSGLVVFDGDAVFNVTSIRGLRSSSTIIIGNFPERTEKTDYCEGPYL